MRPNVLSAIELQSFGRERSQGDAEIVKLCATMKTMLEDLGTDDEGDGGPFPLPNVNAGTVTRRQEVALSQDCLSEEGEKEESTDILLGSKHSSSSPSG